MIADRLRIKNTLFRAAYYPREHFNRMDKLTKQEINDLANRYRADILEYASELKMCKEEYEQHRHAFISKKIEELQTKYQVLRGKKVPLS
jgi:galactose-1-phosphate uridylyltransferase